MRITELAKMASSNTDQIRYLERKGFIQSKSQQIRVRKVRDFSEIEARKALLIMQYCSVGYRLEAAYQKALDELQQPRLV